MRYIDLIVIHCSATRCNRHYTVMQLIRDHADRFGFTGYHYYITRDGTVTQTRHEQLIGAHAKGYNQHSLGVCYEGGLDKEGNPADTRTRKQKRALITLLKKLKAEHPAAQILGHRDLPDVHKACPCFDAIPEYANINDIFMKDKKNSDKIPDFPMESGIFDDSLHALYNLQCFLL